jgi:ATP-dependent Clp protease ATP-binding subunit ClpA
VARLIGAPPGYVGYDQGGLLVDAVRKQPYAVLLLDEIEKAHSDLFNILLQVMDHATLTDNQGREADFRHVTLIMTSNAGAREMQAQGIGFGAGRASDGRKEIEKLSVPSSATASTRS